MTVSLDKEGYLVDLGDWTPDVALLLAEREQVTLNDDHWAIIFMLRAYYERTEVSPAMRALVKLTATELDAAKGNSIYLMGLFGSSPAKLAAKLAGLPRPTNCL